MDIDKNSDWTKSTCGNPCSDNGPLYMISGDKNILIDESTGLYVSNREELVANK